VGFQDGDGGLGREEMGEEMRELGLPTDWLSGSGGTGETPSHYRAKSGKARTNREQGSRCPLETGLAGVFGMDI
jgi:hypothetical protein